MGNIVSPHFLTPKQIDPAALDSNELQEKIAQAIQKKHLRIGCMGLTNVPNALLQPNNQSLTAQLKSLDLHSNHLQHFPCIELPCLSDLNLWGNNLTDEMFSPHEPLSSNFTSNPTDPQKRPKPKRPKRSKKNELASGVFSKLPSLEILDLGNNHLTELPSSLKDCSRLSQLLLSGNFLSSDKKCLSSLEGLSNLTFLDLDLNQLDEIPPFVWTDKPKIYTLLLRGNCIAEVPSQLGQLTALQKLHLGDNAIHTVHPGAFEPLSKMKNLILFNNQISSLPDECFLQYQNLTHLDLSRNSLLWLPSLSGLESLRNLNVSRNLIESLPDLSNLFSLTDLNASFNRLGDLPHSIGKLTQLRVLNCCANQLMFLPATMVWLQCLDVLNLQSNRFTHGGSNLNSNSNDGNQFNPEQFEKDAFFKNCLDDRIEFGLSPVWSLKRLQTLHLGLNQLTELPLDAFSSLSLIRTINLAGNLLTQRTLPHFGIQNSHSPEKKLDSSNSSNENENEDENENRSVKISMEGKANGSLEPCKEHIVETLLLNSNNISEFPLEKLRNLKSSLTVLTLDGNPIKQIPPEIAIFSKLKRLTISAPVLESSEDNSDSENNKKKPRLNSSPIGLDGHQDDDLRFSDESSLVLFPEEIGSLENLERVYVGNHFRQQSTRIGLNFSSRSEDRKSPHDDEENESESSSRKNRSRILSHVKCTDIRDHEAFPGSCAVEVMGQLDSRVTGWSICTGNAPHPVEDCIAMKTFPIGPGDQNVDFVGVFDGHGGNEVSSWIQKSLGEILRKYLPDRLDEFSSQEEMSLAICRAICDAFDEANHRLEQQLKDENRIDGAVGSTAVILLIFDQFMYCANVGDSRAVLATKSKSSGMSVADMQDEMDQVQLQKIPKSPKKSSEKGHESSRRGSLRNVRLSVDHKPGLRKEVARIRKANLFVMPDVAGGSSYRMGYATGPAIAVSRAFGDFFLAPGVSAKPHIHCHQLKAMDQFVVMGSDGVWDVLSDEEVSRFVFHLLKHLHLVLGYDLTVCCNIAASRVRDLAFSLGSNDDISVVVVLLNFAAEKQHRKRTLFS